MSQRLIVYFDPWTLHQAQAHRRYIQRGEPSFSMKIVVAS